MTTLQVIRGSAEPEAWVDAEEMCRQLGVSRSTLYRAIRDGQIREGTCTWRRRTRRFLPSVVKRELRLAPEGETS